MGFNLDQERWKVRLRKHRGSKVAKELAGAFMLIGLLMNIPAGYFVAFPGSDFVFTLGGFLFVAGFLLGVLNAAVTDSIDARIGAQTMLAIGILLISVGWYWSFHRALVIAVGVLFLLASALVFIVTKKSA